MIKKEHRSWKRVIPERKRLSEYPDKITWLNVNMWKVERPNIEKQSKSMESWELLEREQLGVSQQ